MGLLFGLRKGNNMKLYIIGILNVVLPVLFIYLCIKVNIKKHGFFYALVFALLAAGIMCNLPFALEYFAWRLPIPTDMQTDIHNKISRFITMCAIFTLPNFIGAFIWPWHFLLPALSVVMLTVKSDKLGKGQILTIIILNVMYILTAYGSVRDVVSWFSQ